MRKTIKKSASLSLLILSLIAVFMPVYAAVSQEGWNPESLKATNLPDRPVADILLTFIDWAIIIIGLLGVIMFIYGGFVYLTAQGESDRAETGKKVLIYAVIGIAVSVLGYVAVKTVNDLLTGGGSNSGGASPAVNTGSPEGPGAPPGGQLPITPGMVGN